MINILLILVTLLILWFVAGYFSARHVTGRQPADPSDPSKRPSNAEDVVIQTEDNLNISAWYIDNKSEKAVIILAGIGCHREYVVNRAENYINKGYSVLLPDLRCTGNSEGSLISFGWHESKDLIACYEFLCNKNKTSIGLHGYSLGAATIVYSLPRISNYEFLVLESCYDNIDNALSNRVAKFKLPSFVYYPFRFFTEKLIKVSSSYLYPEKYIINACAPTLIMAGDDEDQLKLEETHNIYQKCGAKFKELHIFKGGKHEDFKLRFEEEYNKVLNSFLEKINA
ncbi:MAG TPA: alpha/beta hydrolase [Cytophagaceae bacterium]